MMNKTEIEDKTLRMALSRLEEEFDGAVILAWKQGDDPATCPGFFAYTGDPHIRDIMLMQTGIAAVERLQNS